MDGKLLEPGSFVDLKDGEEVDFGDGKRYIIRYAGAHVILLQVSATALHDSRSCFPSFFFVQP